MTRVIVLLAGLVSAVPGASAIAAAQSVDTVLASPAAPTAGASHPLDSLEVPAAAAAERSPAAPGQSPDAFHTLRWWHGAAALGGLSVLMAFDHPVQRYARHNSGAGADHVAGLVRHVGQPEVYGTVTVGLLAAGLISGNDAVTRTGGRLAASLAVAAVATEAGKFAFGRPRPEQSLDADGYSPFSGQVSMPSGHTSLAFAMATSLADDIHRPWATVGLYGLATAVGWSRINDNRHWLSDVAAGALVGITSAKLASGRWRIFGLRPPSVLTGPQGTGLGYHFQF
jgi:membrane-associated phospholipid phosphatase